MGRMRRGGVGCVLMVLAGCVGSTQIKAFEVTGESIDALGQAFNTTATGMTNGASHSTLTEVEWATAENVARLIGGELTVHDAEGRTTFALTLPLRS